MGWLSGGRKDVTIVLKSVDGTVQPTGCVVVVVIVGVVVGNRVLTGQWYA